MDIMHSIDYLLIMYIMIPVFIHSFIHSFIVSSSLANQISNHLYTIPTTSICGSPLVIQDDSDCYKVNQSGWSSIIVNEGLCNSMTGSLSISNNTLPNYLSPFIFQVYLQQILKLYCLLFLPFHILLHQKVYH